MKDTKYGTSSSIIILDYDVNYQKFRVIKRVELPRSEYSYDTAVNTIIELNKVYMPAFIYVDAGSGEYQYERLHIYGDEHPESGLKNKVKRWQFSQTIDIEDPITHEIDKKPMKPFMVNQLVISFERDNMILSPYDTTLLKQLTDYEVVGMSKTKQPIFTDKDEHYVDALGLAFLAMTLEFKDLTNQIKEMRIQSIIKVSSSSIVKGSMGNVFAKLTESYSDNKMITQIKDSDDLRSDRPVWIKTPMRKKNRYSRSMSFARNSNFRRTMW